MNQSSLFLSLALPAIDLRCTESPFLLYLLLKNTYFFLIYNPILIKYSLLSPLILLF